jgi:putative aldouronate transport system substrate-binding protein
MKLSLGKVVCFALIVVLVFSLAACAGGGGSGSPGPGTDTGSSPTSDTSTTADSGSASGDAGELAADDTDWREGYFDPFGKYNETVEITHSRIAASWMAFDEGDDVHNNWWTRHYLSELNVDLKNVLVADGWGEPYETLINMAIATDDLPDAIYIYSTLGTRLIQGNKVMDLAELYEKTASDEIKYIYNMQPEALAAWQFGDKIYGLSGTKGTSGWFFFWTPQSLIDNLNDGIVPETWAEIEEYAEKVKGHTGGAAIGMQENLEQLHWLAHAFGANGEWEEKNGRLEWGRVQPEMKNVWVKFAEWYDRGLIARDFASKNSEDLESDWINGRVGIMVHGTNFSHDSLGRNWKALHMDDELVAIPMPSATGRPVTIVESGAYSDALMINIKCENPDAVMRCINFTQQVFSEVSRPDWITDTAFDNGASGGWATFWSTIGFNSVKDIADRTPENSSAYKLYQAYMSGADGSDLPVMARVNLERVRNWELLGDTADDWGENWAYYMMFVGAATHPYAWTVQNQVIFSPRRGQPTEAEAENGTNLAEKFKEYATLSIMNNNAEQGFDDWVSYFYANGGNEIYEEVNVQYRNQ